MAVSGKYGKVEIAGMGDDEPVFILRAQDKLAGPTIEMYRVLVGSHGSLLAEGLQSEIERFRSWTGTKKVPD